MPRRTNLFSYSFALVLSASLLANANLPSSVRAAEPNDVFGDATVLPSGTLSVSDTIDGLEGPDTYLGFFADDTFTPPPLEEDDDSSPLGNGLADALFDIPVNADGSIPLAVTGCCDDFDGSHGEEGEYELIVDVFDAGGGTLDSFSVFSTLMPGIVDEFAFSDPSWIGGSFTAVIDNLVAVDPDDDPVDFWVFTGLTPGASYVAEIVDADFDTLLGVFDGGGTLEDTDDDGGFDLLSKLDVTADGSGEVVLAVTGFPDFDVFGAHSEVGDYTLTLTLVPEPTSAIMMLLGVGGLVGAIRRR